MKNPVLTPEEAIAHIKSKSDFRANLRSLAIKILNWTIDWNKDQPPDNRVLCFLREEVNVGLFLDRDGNREKTNRPNFLVIKGARDYLDFGLGRDPDGRYRALFNQPKGHETRWLLPRERFPLVSTDLLRGAFMDALRRQLAESDSSQPSAPRQERKVATAVPATPLVPPSARSESPNDPLTDAGAAKQFVARAREIFLEHEVTYPWVDAVEGAEVARAGGGYRRIAAVESNTARGFHKIDKAGPGALEVYRGYFVTNRDELLGALTGMRSRRDLHAWSERVSDDIRGKLTNIKQDMLRPYNKVRKLVDLHVENLVSTAAELVGLRERLVPWLFMPLDSQILSYPTLLSETDLRKVGLTRGATYKDVATRAAYDALQERLVERAADMSRLTGSIFHPIYFDLLWSRRYLNWGRNLYETVPGKGEARGSW
jgi:hypothetical protein